MARERAGVPTRHGRGDSGAPTPNRRLAQPFPCLAGATRVNVAAPVIPPHNLDTERAVLGSILREPTAAAVALALARPEYFFTDYHRAIFAAAQRAHARGAADLVTVTHELLQDDEALAAVNGRTYLLQLFDEGAIPAHVEHYVAELADLAAKRDILRHSIEWQHAASNGASATALLASMAAAVASLDAQRAGPREPQLVREGLDVALVWPGGIRFELTAIRDGRDGVRGDLVVAHGPRRLHSAALALSSTTAREAWRKVLVSKVPGLPWGDMIEEACWRMTAAVRQGDPPVDVATYPASGGPVCVMPGLAYRGDPTEIHADADSLKSMTGDAMLVSIATGKTLPFGLKPAITGPVDLYDWETHESVHADRMQRIARGLGADLPPGAITYKRMKGPLVNVAGQLAADAQRRGVVVSVFDSMVFALGSGDGGFHEPITAFYNALRLFDRMAVVVMNHVTNSDARAGGAARPYGGMFAFAGPRLVWEAKRDREATDGAVVTFTNTKANSHPKQFDPFGLRFVHGPDAITIYPADLRESAHALPAASMSYHVRLALARGVDDPEAIVHDLAAIGKRASVDSIKRLIRLERQRTRGREA